MRQWIFKIFALLSVAALLPLQYVLLRNVYNSLADSVFRKVDSCFSQSVREELSRRDTLYSDSLYLNWESLNATFTEKLRADGLGGTEYKIVMESLSPSGSSAVGVIPISAASGVRVLVNNPFKLVISKMLWLLIASLAFSIFGLFSIFKLLNILSRLKKLSRMRQDHTYGMIHDMKTPLSTISLIAEDLASESVSAPFVEEVRILGQESRHLNRMCEQIIAVAKLEQSKLAFNWEPIDIASFFGEVIKKFDKPVFTISCAENCGLLYCDRLYLEEILNNLIDNAIKYSREPRPAVFLSAFLKPSSPHKGKFVELHVKDNGIGISDDFRRKLFMKFERGENTVGLGGHGMGLNYVYQLMKGLKGYVKIYSRAGEFTEVVLGFPSGRHNISAL